MKSLPGPGPEPPDLSSSAPEPAPLEPPGRWGRVWREETAQFHPRLWLAQCFLRLLPAGTGGRLRTLVYRRAGLRIGPGTVIAGSMTFGNGSRVRDNFRIGARCYINSHVFVDAAAAVTLGDGVSIGHHAVVITTDHAIGPPEFRAGTRREAPVTIGDGAWIAACVTLLPGVTVGPGAVVAAGAVVTRDVPPHTLVGGVPARVLRDLPI